MGGAGLNEPEGPPCENYRPPGQALFETPFGLELLATIHWVATCENAADAETAAAKVYTWNDRKKRFSSRQISIAFEILRTNGWLPAA